MENIFYIDNIFFLLIKQHNFSIILTIFFGFLIISIFDILYTKENQIKKLQYKSLYLSLTIFILSLILWFNFNTNENFQYINYYFINNYTKFSMCFAIDGISIYFIILTTILTPICLLISFNRITFMLKEYIISFFSLQLFIILSFTSLDLFFFYLFFESILIPMFLIITIWGSKTRKIKAAYYFFFYTLLSSSFMLLGIIYIHIKYQNTNILYLYLQNFTFQEQKILWVLFFIAFATKIPMFPFHLWLPEAHVEAPTGGSVILAGLLLKLGGYGFIRFLIPLFPLGCKHYLPIIYTLSLLGIFYASFTVLRQIDLKRIIAYSSVAHMSFVVLGIFTLTCEGIEGGILLMLGHGIVSSALFLLVGFIYDRHQTRLIRYYGGIAVTMPVFAMFFLFFNLANLSFPGTSNFIGELLILTALSNTNTIVFFFSTIGIILAAVYSIWLFNRICFGSLKVNFIKTFNDLINIEITILILLTVLCLVIGFYPNFLLNKLNFSIEFILKLIKL